MPVPCLSPLLLLLARGSRAGTLAMWRQDPSEEEYVSEAAWPRDFPGSPVVKAPRVHCRGHRLVPCLGN